MSDDPHFNKALAKQAMSLANKSLTEGDDEAYAENMLEASQLLAKARIAEATLKHQEVLVQA